MSYTMIYSWKWFFLHLFYCTSFNHYYIVLKDKSTLKGEIHFSSFHQNIIIMQNYYTKFRGLQETLLPESNHMLQ